MLHPVRHPSSRSSVWSFTLLSFVFVFSSLGVLPFARANGLDAAVSPLRAFDELIHLQGQTVVDLLDYLRSNVTGSDRVPDYDRAVDFGSWIHRTAGDCRNTRAYVLVRDADATEPIKYTNASSCSVLTGLWHDPYTGRDFKKARELDIDHVVPLHSAWQSGASRWPSARRCHYANYMENAIHLKAVSSTENRSKGDKGPEAYFPPNTLGACAYLSSWLKIKTIWELSASEAEISAIANLLMKNGCQASDNQMSAQELLAQRQASQNVIPGCTEFFNSYDSEPTDGAYLAPPPGFESNLPTEVNRFH